MTIWMTLTDHPRSAAWATAEPLDALHKLRVDAMAHREYLLPVRRCQGIYRLKSLEEELSMTEELLRVIAGELRQRVMG